MDKVSKKALSKELAKEFNKSNSPMKYFKPAARNSLIKAITKMKSFGEIDYTSSFK